MDIPVYFSQKAFILHHGCVLAVRHNGADTWEVPGGRLKSGENLDEQIIREVVEETGIQITPGLPFALWKWAIDDGPNFPGTIVAVARVCKAHTSEITLSEHALIDSLEEVCWIPLEKITETPWQKDLRPALDTFLQMIPGFA